MNPVTPGRMLLAMDCIEQERRRQENLQQEGRFAFTPAHDGMIPTQKLACLMEELGEVARQTLAGEGIVQEKHDDRALFKELTQLAALTCAWMECFL